jgi:hypothetical protein
MPNPSNQTFPEFRDSALRVFDDFETRIKKIEQSLAELRRQLEDIRRKP